MTQLDTKNLIDTIKPYTITKKEVINGNIWY